MSLWVIASFKQILVWLSTWSGGSRWTQWGVLAAGHCHSWWCWWLSNTSWVTLTRFWQHSFLLHSFWICWNCHNGHLESVNCARCSSQPAFEFADGYSPSFSTFLIALFLPVITKFFIKFCKWHRWARLSREKGKKKRTHKEDRDWWEGCQWIGLWAPNEQQVPFAGSLYCIPKCSHTGCQFVWLWGGCSQWWTAKEEVSELIKYETFCQLFQSMIGWGDLGLLAGAWTYDALLYSIYLWKGEWVAWLFFSEKSISDYWERPIFWFTAVWCTGVEHWL